MDRMTISGRDGLPRYQLLDDVTVEVKENKDGWAASCSEYSGCVGLGTTADEALDAFAEELKKHKEEHVN